MIAAATTMSPMTESSLSGRSRVCTRVFLYRVRARHLFEQREPGVQTRGSAAAYPCYLIQPLHLVGLFLQGPRFGCSPA
jgi:hypothetical protein